MGPVQTHPQRIEPHASEHKFARCPLCGFEFEWTDGLTCVECAWRSACPLVRCPACSYEFPAEGYPASRLLRWLSRLSRRKATPTSRTSPQLLESISVSSATDASREADILEIRRRRLMEWILTEFPDLPEADHNWVAIIEGPPGPQIPHDHSEALAQSLDQLCTRLGHPRYCPHSKPIPVGDCCLTSPEHQETALFRTVKDLQPGETARLLYLSPRHPAHFFRLTNMGFTPGAIITLQQSRPVRVLRVGRAQVALDDQVAEHIFVRPLPD